MKKLYRSSSDQMIAGVCSGLADYFEVDPAIIRLAFVLLFFVGSGGFWVYIILWIVMPLESQHPAGDVEVKSKPAEKPLQVEEPHSDDIDSGKSQ